MYPLAEHGCPPHTSDALGLFATTYLGILRTPLCRLPLPLRFPLHLVMMLASWSFWFVVGWLESESRGSDSLPGSGWSPPMLAAGKLRWWHNIQNWTDSTGVGLNVSPDHQVGVVGQPVSGQTTTRLDSLKQKRMNSCSLQGEAELCCGQDWWCTMSTGLGGCTKVCQSVLGHSV